MTSHATMGHPVLIETGLLEPVLNELSPVPYVPQKLVAEAPKLSKAAGTQTSQLFSCSGYAPLHFRNGNAIAKSYKRMEVVSTTSRGLQHLLFAENHLIAGFSPFI